MQTATKPESDDDDDVIFLDDNDEVSCKWTI